MKPDARGRLVYWLKILALPVSLIAIIASLYLARSLFPLPTDEELRELARHLFARYGLALVFLSGLIEGVLLIGWYFPGTTVILFCLLFAANDAAAISAMAAAASTGLSLAYAFNYALGRFGWYRLFLAAGLGEPLERARIRLEKHGFAFLMLSYWQFTFASLTSTAAGILRLNFTSFLVISLLAALFWVSFWSTLIYLLGERATTLVGLPFIVGVLLAWVAVSLLIRLYRAGAKKRHSR
jgi:membrane protein DedA with SNARE-associated domain